MPRGYMGAGHLASAGGAIGTYQPQHQNHFLFEVDLADLGLDSDKLTLSVESAFAPSVSNDPVELIFLNERRYVAGQTTFDAGQITYRDFTDIETARILASWRNRVYSPYTGKVGYAADYKRECDLVTMGPDGSGDRIWKIIGAWPQAVTYGQYDYNGSEQVRMEVTLYYDLAYPISLNPFPKTESPNPAVP